MMIQLDLCPTLRVHNHPPMRRLNPTLIATQLDYITLIRSITNMCHQLIGIITNQFWLVTYTHTHTHIMHLTSKVFRNDNAFLCSPQIGPRHLTFYIPTQAVEQ